MLGMKFYNMVSHFSASHLKQRTLCIVYIQLKLKTCHYRENLAVRTAERQGIPENYIFNQLRSPRDFGKNISRTACPTVSSIFFLKCCDLIFLIIIRSLGCIRNFCCCASIKLVETLYVTGSNTQTFALGKEK